MTIYLARPLALWYNRIMKTTMTRAEVIAEIGRVYVGDGTVKKLNGGKLPAKDRATPVTFQGQARWAIYRPELPQRRWELLAVDPSTAQG